MPETDLTQESYSFMEASRPQVRTMGLEGLASSVLSKYCRTGEVAWHAADLGLVPSATQSPEH